VAYLTAAAIYIAFLVSAPDLQNPDIWLPITILFALLNPQEYEGPTTLVQRRFEATQMAVERVLGAPSGSLPIADKDAVAAWFAD
jgi:hypothetical protein